MVPVEPSDGWSASTYDTNKLMRVFDTLWVKAGFALHVYAFRAGSNGNGIRWSGSCALGFSWTLDCERVLAGGVSR